MKSFLFNACVLVTIGFIVSCKDPLATECDIESPAPVLEINIPDTLTLTSTLPMKVQISNGCGNYSKLKTERDVNVLYIYPIARYQGCICTQEIKELVVNPSLTFPQTGNFTLQVFSAQGNFITKRVFVR
jgi:hypothetical protein